MRVETHNPAQEFSGYREQSHQLKMTDQHFSNSFEEYHDVHHDVRRFELEIETNQDD